VGGGGGGRSGAEAFVEELAAAGEGAAAPGPSGTEPTAREELERLRGEVIEVQEDIDAAYARAFPLTDEDLEEAGFPQGAAGRLGEKAFAALGRASPEVAARARERAAADEVSWMRFQREANQLKLRKRRAEQKAARLEAALAQIARPAGRASTSARSRVALPPPGAPVSGVAARIVLITGFESFNVGLYAQVAEELRRRAPGVDLRVFSDRDLSTRRGEVEAALAEADVFFGSLLFDFDQVEWLKARVEAVPVRLIFESALELMSSTQVGDFNMKQGPGAKKKGPPPVVKKVLSLFGSQREEDKLVGYLSFLKIGPKLLRWVPGEKARHLRNWLTVYGYWNQGGLDNVVGMFLYLVREYFGDPGVEPLPVVETPATGVLHPDYSDGYFETPAEYLDWYAHSGPLRSSGAPVVAVLLYRKHVITRQPYIAELVSLMEGRGLIPVPIFINGVEAHTIVRDLLTSSWEREAGGGAELKKGFAEVDALVSTIGFPLVGGPAGTMEGGRQAEVAKEILQSKNLPYFVAAPLLIQDLQSWDRDGIQGLQSVVLYSLPELDGAIDTVPIGGLVGNDIYLINERVERLCSRISKWVNLRRQPKLERKVAILLYGFPPGVGATGTAALLNVPQSLENVLQALAADGYDVGGDAAGISGEDIVRTLRAFEGNQRMIMGGAASVAGMDVDSGLTARGVRSAADEVPPSELKDWLRFPATWGPTEWGPIDYLPSKDILVDRLERQWGDLGAQSPGVLGITSSGSSLVPGLQVGNVWIGIQPLLGLEGDPMRLLFERDLTPHPQYAAFYKWLQKDFEADAVVHLGMHGTVEWLPGSPLGNSGMSWSDVLVGNLPNLYVYAANNPSESVVAKRRGYGTMVSHNVPPYGRAGLYKQLVVLRDLLNEYREDPVANSVLCGAIVENVSLCGLGTDCPFSAEQIELSQEDVAEGEVPPAGFQEYTERLYAYLQVVEGRLFSEGLHCLGATPTHGQMVQYLSAYLCEKLPNNVVEAIAAGSPVDAESVLLDMQRAAGDASMIMEEVEDLITRGIEVAALLKRNTEEIDSLLRGLSGQYVLPEAGGDLLRDGPGVLPTGRNIHALDPYRMPSPAAMERGSKLAEAIVEQHLKETGSYPETVTVALWGLDAIKTRGESVGILLGLVGARPVKEGTGRIARYEPIPLSELPKGRPRVDVLANMSGIFRDSFQNVVELLDDMFLRLAELDEPEELNFIKKHSNDMVGQGIERAASRLFSNPAGDYGSMVNERVGASNWSGGDELGETWASRNSFSYGRGSERGSARGDVLEALLSTTDRVVQEIDSIEYGLTDIQEYYANTGALTNAAGAARKRNGREGKVGCSVVEAFGGENSNAPRELEDVLRLEYRSKFLNPRWAEAMAAQGSGGAFEISQRMTALIGWGGTVGFSDAFVYDQAVETYVLDEDMAQTLRRNNPDAFKNVLQRFIEASGRGLWDADEALLEKLQAMYQDLDDQIEGVYN